jgi:C-terminal processing protease CtpA/Prc
MPPFGTIFFAKGTKNVVPKSVFANQPTSLALMLNLRDNIISIGQIKSRNVTLQKVINFTDQEANRYFTHYLCIPLNTQQTKLSE